MSYREFNLQRKVNMSHQAHILIVDDNQINRQYFSMSIKKIFLRVDVAENGIQAIKLAKHNNYNLILMDIRMPEMDGYETTKNIRLLENHQETIIIATSAENIRIQQKQLFDDFIAKPIRPKQLQDIIQKYTINEKTNAPVFNQKTALKYAYNDKDIMQKLISMFIKELPKQLQELDQAVEVNNRVLCVEILHKLRGSCLTCGADILNNEGEKLSDTINSNLTNDSLTTHDIHKAAQNFIQLF